MSEKIVLQPEEKILFKSPVSLVTGKLVTRTGVCYLTTQRIVVVSEALLAGAAAGVSILASALLRKTKRLGTQTQEIQFRYLGNVKLSSYGLNKTVDIRLEDGSWLRIAFSAKGRRNFLQALDDALRAHGLQRVAEGEDSWWVKPIVT